MSNPRINGDCIIARVFFSSLMCLCCLNWTTWCFWIHFKAKARWSIPLTFTSLTKPKAPWPSGRIIFRSSSFSNLKNRLFVRDDLKGTCPSLQTLFWCIRFLKFRICLWFFHKRIDNSSRFIQLSWAFRFFFSVGQISN